MRQCQDFSPSCVWPMLGNLCAPMPAAMPPYPALPARSEWCFQNPVGVDCSAAEPRCIWLAVLRGAPLSSPSPPTMRPVPVGNGHGCTSRALQRSHQPRVRTMPIAHHACGQGVCMVEVCGSTSESQSIELCETGVLLIAQCVCLLVCLCVSKRELLLMCFLYVCHGRLVAP